MLTPYRFQASEKQGPRCGMGPLDVMLRRLLAWHRNRDYDSWALRQPTDTSLSKALIHTLVEFHLLESNDSISIGFFDLNQLLGS